MSLKEKFCRPPILKISENDLNRVKFLRTIHFGQRDSPEQAQLFRSVPNSEICTSISDLRTHF
jgi:hypothetical protein